MPSLGLFRLTRRFHKFAPISLRISGRSGFHEAMAPQPSSVLMTFLDGVLLLLPGQSRDEEIEMAEFLFILGVLPDKNDGFDGARKRLCRWQ